MLAQLQSEDRIVKLYDYENDKDREVVLFLYYSIFIPYLMNLKRHCNIKKTAFIIIFQR